MSAAVAGIFGGALGGGLAVTVLAPLTAANNFLGSYFFGSGMILGERQMYQDDWIKIKKRLDAGESFLVILEEVMKPNTQAVMQMARETVIAVSAEWNKIVLDYLGSLSNEIRLALGIPPLTGQDEYEQWLRESGFGTGKKTDTPPPPPPPPPAKELTKEQIAFEKAMSDFELKARILKLGKIISAYTPDIKKYRTIVEQNSQTIAGRKKKEYIQAVKLLAQLKNSRNKYLIELKTLLNEQGIRGI